MPRDEIRRFSPKHRSSLPEHILCGDTRHRAALQLSQPTLSLLEPQGFAVGIDLGIQAVDEAHSQASTRPRRQLKGLGFDVACGIRHKSNLPQALSCAHHGEVAPFRGQQIPFGDIRVHDAQVPGVTAVGTR